MVKKLLACLLLAVLWCSCASAEWMLNTVHRSITDFVNGKPDYTNARFLGIWSAAADWDSSATQADVNLTGTMTFSGGNYSFWNGRNGGMLTNSGTQRTFGLASDMNTGEGLVYVPLTASGDQVIFCLAADDGLNGVNVSWNFPGNPSYNRQSTFPDYMTTQEQLESYVPYVEYISSGSQVTGLRWRVVSPNNTSEAVTFAFRAGFRVFFVRNAGGYSLYSGHWQYVEAGNPVSGEVTFDSPVNEADIKFISAGWNYGEGSAERIYQWRFCKPSTPELSITENFMFDASIVNGKANYSDAKFESLFFDIYAGNVMAEARHFTAEGSVTIPGGGYSLMDDNGEKELGVTIPEGTDKTFKLRMHKASAPGDTYLEYQPIYDNGANLTFSGGAEKLAGRTLTWTFPAELNLSGSGKIQDFKSTAEQLATGAPYFEIVSRDGNITAINYRIVTSSDTSTAVTPSYRTDFRIEYYRINPDPAEGERYRSSWMNNTASGTWTLGNPQPLSNIEKIAVRYRTWEDSNNSRQYIWNFYLAEAPSTPAITTTSLPAATVGTSYKATLESNISGATWSVISGSLPDGLELDPTTGDIIGTPEATGNYTFTVRAENDSESADKQFTITVSKNQGGSTGITPLGGTSGGCEAGLSASGLFLLALLVKRLRGKK